MFLESYIEMTLTSTINVLHVRLHAILNFIKVEFQNKWGQSICDSVNYSRCYNVHPTFNDDFISGEKLQNDRRS